SLAEAKVWLPGAMATDVTSPAWPSSMTARQSPEAGSRSQQRTVLSALPAANSTPLVEDAAATDVTAPPNSRNPFRPPIISWRGSGCSGNHRRRALSLPPVAMILGPSMVTAVNALVYPLDLDNSFLLVASHMRRVLSALTENSLLPLTSSGWKTTPVTSA